MAKIQIEESALESLQKMVEQLQGERDELLRALVEIKELEDTEENEWDAVERVIPEMCSIASNAIAKCTAKPEVLE